MLRIRRDGADTLVASDGATLPGHRRDARGASSGIPVLIDDRAGSPQPLNPVLVQLLSTIAQRFPAVFGCSVAAYLWGADDVVSIWTSTGWRAVLGHLDTEDALAALPEQIETLAALKGQLNFAQADASATSTSSRRGEPGERRAPRASRRGERGAPARSSPRPSRRRRHPSVRSAAPAPADASPSRRRPRRRRRSASPTLAGIVLNTVAGTTPTRRPDRGVLADAIPGTRGAQRGEDRARRRRAIHREEVHARRAAGEQLGALERRPRDPELEHRIGVVLA